MAANAPPEQASGNPCCLAWQGKYLGMKKRRDAFKEATTLLQKAIEDAISEKSNLEKKLVEMAAERDSKENDSAVKVSLEKEISDLKSEILSLQRGLEQNAKEKSEEIKILQDQASSREKEINELKEILTKEKLRADSFEEEREKVCIELNKIKGMVVKDEEIKPEARKEISLVKNLLASERQKTELEKKKASQYCSELEVLRTAAQKTSSDLLTLTSNLETVKKQYEFEKQKTLKERKRAELESAKAKEQMKLSEGLSKKCEIVRAKNEELKKEMELQSASSKVKFTEISTKLEEKMMLLEMNKKTATEWKSRADDLTQQLQEAQAVTESLKKQVHELSLSQNSMKAPSISPHKVIDMEKAEVRLLKKELKFERNRAKHSKKVAKFEKFQRKFQLEQLSQLKLEFGSFTNRKNLLDEYFSKGDKGTAGLGKAKRTRKLQMIQSQKNHTNEKLSDASCQLVAISGTISQLESPTGGSRKLQSSGVISSETSFSDGQLLASQGGKQVSVITSAEIAKAKPSIQPTKPSMVLKISDTRKSAENYLQSRQRDSHEVVNEQSRKRKGMLEAVESRKHLTSNDKKKKLLTGEKMDTLQTKVVETGSRPLEEEGGSFENCMKASKKRRISCEKKTIIQNSLEFNGLDKTPGTIVGSKQVSTAKKHDAETVLLEDAIAIDYRKLLELDNPEDETYYKMARKSLLSPDLPQIDFAGGEIMNNDKNPAMAVDLAASNSTDFHETIISSEIPSLNTQNDSVTVIMPPTSTRLHDHIPKHFAVFSNVEDQNSIIKISNAANNCIHRWPSVNTGQWAVPAILLSMNMEKNLLGQEKVCVFLSLLLHNFSVVSSMKFGNTLNVDSFSCFDSLSQHIHSVMADIEAGGMLSELSEELLCLLQDLLCEQRVLFSVKTSETSESDLSIPITLNGENLALISRTALIDHLVAGSAILAAICTALGRVGFIFEASFEILHKRSHEKTSVILTILHVFAYIAGEKMMSSNDHDVSIGVLKSIVMYLENKDFGTVEENAKLHRGKNKCRFSDKSSSLEAMASMLLEILQEFSSLHQSLTGSSGSSHLEKIEFSPVHKDFQWVLTRDQSGTSYHLGDILSLIELIASYTPWDWTSANIVAPLLKMLEVPLPMNLSVAIVSLLGQLSSIGVEAGGYENEGISNVREKLLAFLQCETTLKAGFAVQIATVSSLIKTLKLDLPIAFQDKTAMVPESGDQSLTASVNLVTKWFSLLSDEQRVFASEFLQTSFVR